MNSGIFPEHLELARATPVHAQIGKSECGNYSPISTIPWYLLKYKKNSSANEFIRILIIINSIICEQQSFRPGHSSETALLYSTNHALGYTNL